MKKIFKKSKKGVYKNNDERIDVLYIVKHKRCCYSHNNNSRKLLARLSTIIDLNGKYFSNNSNSELFIADAIIINGKEYIVNEIKRLKKFTRFAARRYQKPKQ